MYKHLLLLYTSCLTVCLIGIQCATLMLIDIWWCLLILPPFLQDSSTYTHSFILTIKVNLIQMLSKNILRYSGQRGIYLIFCNGYFAKNLFSYPGQTCSPSLLRPIFCGIFLVLEIFQPARLPGHFSSQRFHSFLCPSLRFLIRLSTYFSLIISYCVTVKWILPFSHWWEVF